MTGKERAAFRKQANALDAIFQVGKEGLSGNMLVGIDNALNKRELIKLTVLENCDENAKTLCDTICRALNAEPIQCIGRKIVIYRKKPEEEK